MSQQEKTPSDNTCQSPDMVRSSPSHVSGVEMDKRFDIELG